MNLKTRIHLLVLVFISSLFLQCSKDDKLNQVGSWDARYTSRQYENDVLISETVSNVEMVLRSNETGIVRGSSNSGEGDLEWDLISSDTKINLVESYVLFNNSVFPQENVNSTIYEILANEKKFQEWNNEFEFSSGGVVNKISRTWRLSR